MWTAALVLLRSNWKQIAIGLAVVGAIWIAYSWAYDRGVAHEKTKSAAMLNRVVEEHNRQVAEADAAATAREHLLQSKVNEQATEIDNAQRVNAEQILALQKYSTTADAARAAAGRLRDALATARVTAAATAVDPAAACASRAGAYEALLARGEELLRVGRDLANRCAGAHDDRAAEVTGLVHSWPK